MISSGDTCPSRSFVACTLELNPLASLFADWPKLRLAMPDCSDFHPEAMVVMSSQVNEWIVAVLRMVKDTQVVTGVENDDGQCRPRMAAVFGRQ